MTLRSGNIKVTRSFDIPTITERWFADLVGELDSAIGRLEFDDSGLLDVSTAPGVEQTELRLVHGRHLAAGSKYVSESELQIEEWSRDRIKIEQTEDASVSSLVIERDRRYGIKNATLQATTGGESRWMRSKANAEFDAGKWFDRKSDALCGEMRVRLARGRISISTTNSNTVDVEVNLHATGILRPLTSIALVVIARRVRKEIVKQIDTFGAESARHVEDALRDGPSETARKIVAGWLSKTAS